MTTSRTSSIPAAPSLFRRVGLPYFVIAFIARLPFAMMVVGVLTVVVAARESVALGGLTSAAVGIGTACFGPLLGAAADRRGQRIVLAVVAVANAVALVGFTLVVYSSAAEPFVLLSAFAIGATAPQVSPMSRSRLVTIIAERVPADRRARTTSSTMSYESAADETVFVFGPFLVGVLATAIAPWMPLVIAAGLILVFVGAFALHPTAAHVSIRRGADGRAGSQVSELFRPRLLVVVLGMLGVGVFFGAMLTSLTAFMTEHGRPEEAGLLYGALGVGSAILALGVAFLPARFPLAARWLLFAGILFVGSLGLLWVREPFGMLIALAVMGCGIGPTLVTQFSLGAAFGPTDRSATVMTMLGSAMVVGQAIGAVATGQVADAAGAQASLLLPVFAAALVLLAGVVNAVLARGGRAAS
ncbi:MFS transporter [Microbacterium azadirachtae]|uniref:Major Facilitator Superfamily protein n=1 Tax=Microbacterium azadirachtae TaxID=582680 RepID=A0A0F0LEQ4_9MICO|nr:MFS transporter [Microbacterium azadirachtae]KJL30755.1 Major Facilitator Superfamily protein [Microbacterium azadirachtae]